MFDVGSLKRTIRIPISWIRTIDTPPIRLADNAITPDDSLVVAGRGALGGGDV